MDELKSLCKGFTTIGLSDMGAVRLMNRREVKYTVHRRVLPLILKRIVNDYHILEMERQHIMPYRSVYFDTRDYRLYTSHQNGKLNRYKVRRRRYELSGTEFLELKFKNNKKRTMKKRIAIGERDGDLSENRLFLAENLPPSLHDLEEKLIVCYRRIMLVNKARSERITIDIDLNCSVPDRATRYGQMAIIEIKTAGKPDSSVIASVLSDLGIKKLSFSKYCLGISELGQGVKTNLMKIRKREIMKSLNRQNRLLLRG